MTPGAAAVIAWSARIHGVGGARHRWALEAAAALDRHGPNAAVLPPFPSRMKTTQAARDDTARRLYRTAGDTR